MIAVIGEALLDLIPHEEDESLYTPRVGGSPLNTAVAIARQGISAAFIVRLADDFFGDRIAAHLKENGVLSDFVKRTSGNREKTTLAFVGKDKEGKLDYSFYTAESADLTISSGDCPRQLPKECCCLALGSFSILTDSFSAAVLPLLKKASTNTVLSYDPNIRPALLSDDKESVRKRVEHLFALSDIVKVSDEDWEWLYGDSPREATLEVTDIFSWGVSLVIYTKGKEGARLMTSEGEAWDAPIFDLPVKDSVGAGDTFHGALLARLYQKELLHKEKLRELSGEELRDIAAYASVAAGINCSKIGCSPPTREETEQFRKRYSD